MALDLALASMPSTGPEPQFISQTARRASNKRDRSVNGSASVERDVAHRFDMGGTGLCVCGLANEPKKLLIQDPLVICVPEPSQVRNNRAKAGHDGRDDLLHKLSRPRTGNITNSTG